MGILNTIGVWIAAGLTLCIFSFLYKDNPFYKFAEHLYVGSSAALVIWMSWSFDIYPMAWVPLSQGHYMLIIPTILGAMLLSRFFPRYGWISRWPIAFSVGIGSGLAIVQGFQGYVIPQLKGSLLPLIPEGELVSNNYIQFLYIWKNPVIVIGVFATVLYFYFSMERRGFLKGGARVGMTYIMVAFGASFGYTVMARISLLIGRIHFLLHDWLHLVQ